MPALGMAQETGKVLRWFKAAGADVARGEPLLEVETDKVTVEIESPADGTLAAVSAAEGAEVITRFPAEELLVTAGGQYTVSGPLPGEREVTSNLNNPNVAGAVVDSARFEGAHAG